MISWTEGDIPWCPQGAQAGEVYHYWDRPLIGLLTQKDVEYVYMCVGGEVEPVNLWWYTKKPDHPILWLWDEMLKTCQQQRGVLAVAPNDRLLVARSYPTLDEALSERNLVNLESDAMARLAIDRRNVRCFFSEIRSSDRVSGR